MALIRMCITTPLLPCHMALLGLMPESVPLIVAEPA